VRFQAEVRRLGLPRVGPTCFPARRLWAPMLVVDGGWRTPKLELARGLAPVLIGLAFAVTESPPPDRPPTPPPDPPLGELPFEAVLPDTEEAKRLYLSAEAVRQQAKALTEELTQAVEAIDAPLKSQSES